MTPDLAADLELARTVALEAAALVRRFRGHEMVVDKKSGDEPVTEADRAASELIVRNLRAARPTDAILSEEVPDDGLRRTSHRVWMVDPIDGTKDFIRGEDGFAVMIGLCIDGRPRVGVVAQPSTGRTTCGAVVTLPEPGVGATDTASPAELAYVEEADGTRRPLRASAVDGPPNIRLVSSRSHPDPRTQAFRDALRITDETHMGGVGLKVGLVAEGVRDLYVYPGSKTKLWDACGPEAILHAAGGRLTDVDGQPLDYTGQHLANRRGLLASNGRIHGLVVSLLAPHMPPRPT